MLRILDAAYAKAHSFRRERRQYDGRECDTKQHPPLDALLTSSFCEMMVLRFWSFRHFVISSFRHFVISSNDERHQFMELMMKHIHILCCCLMLVGGCKKESKPVSPETITGKRDYTWVRDTIQYLGNAQTAMQSMYGTSGNNVFIVGHCEVMGGRMYHYDGSGWQPVALSSIRGSFNAIGGSSASNIWVVGAVTNVDPHTGGLIDSNLIVRFDGSTWTRHSVVGKGSLWCVSVFSQTLVWAGGSDGTVLRFDGAAWSTDSLGRQYFVSSIAAVSNSLAYCIAHVEDNTLPIDSAGSFLFRFDGTHWEKFDSVMHTPGAPSAHFGTGVYSWNGKLFTIGPNIYELRDESWIKLAEAMVGHMSQSAANNIIAVGRGAWHYNGVDWRHFEELGDALGYDCFADGQKVFIVGNDNFRTLLVRGQ